MTINNENYGKYDTTMILEALDNLSKAYSEGRTTSIEIPKDVESYHCDCSEDCR